MRILYVCEGCGIPYESEDECGKCEAQTDTVDLKVGDIVLAKRGLGWYDGLKEWVSNPGVLKRRAKNKHGNCFDKCCTFQFYYVVTAIDTHEHRTRYHLFTLAMTGKSGHSGGHTFNHGHYTPKLVKSPPKRILAGAAALVGKTSEYLL